MIRLIRLLDTRHPRLLLAAFCLAMWLPGILSVPPSDRDESRFAQATSQMIETGDYVTIRNGTEARNRKPIGIHWLQLPGVAMARAMGLATANPIWPYRIPSLLGALLAVLATHAIGVRLFDRRTAMLAAAMLGGSVLLAVEANIAKTDAVLVGLTTLAMAVLARAYLERGIGRGGAALFWLATGLAILVKGPVMPMVAALAVVSLVTVDRRAAWLKALRAAWGLPLMLAVVLPWFVAIGISTHGQFFRDAVGGDLGAKLAGGDDAHGAPPLYHTVLLCLTLFPVAPAVVCALPEAWRRRREPAMRFLLAWAVPSWIVFEAVPTKLPHYILPLLPALCLLGAVWAAGSGKPAPKWLSLPAWLLFGVAALALGGGAVALPFVVGGWSWTVSLGLAALAAVGFLVWRVRAANARLERVVAGIACMPLVIWTVLGLLVPHEARLWISPRIAAARAAISSDAPLATVGFAEPSLLFLAGTATRLLSGGAAGAAFLAEGPGRVLGVESRDLDSFLAANRTPARVAGRIDGFNYSNGRKVSITLFAD